MARQVLLLLLVGAEGHDRRADPVEAHVLRAAGLVVGPHLLAHDGLVPHRAAAPAVLRGPGDGEQALVGERLAEALGDVEVGGVVGERAEVVLGDVRGDQRAQPGCAARRPARRGRSPSVSPSKPDADVSSPATCRSHAAVPPSVARVLDERWPTTPSREALVTRAAAADLRRPRRRRPTGPPRPCAALGVRPGDRVAAVAAQRRRRGGGLPRRHARSARCGWASTRRWRRRRSSSCSTTPAPRCCLTRRRAARRSGCAVRRPRPAWRAAVAAAPDRAGRGRRRPAAPRRASPTRAAPPAIPRARCTASTTCSTPGAVLVESRGYGRRRCARATASRSRSSTWPCSPRCSCRRPAGCSIVMDRIDAEGVAEWIRTERVTTWNGPPALLHSLATDGRRWRRPTWRRSTRCGPAGPTAPRSIRSTFEAKFGLPVLATYGLSEAPDRGGHRPARRPARRRRQRPAAAAPAPCASPAPTAPTLPAGRDGRDLRRPRRRPLPA